MVDSNNQDKALEDSNSQVAGEILYSLDLGSTTVDSNSQALIIPSNRDLVAKRRTTLGSTFSHPKLCSHDLIRVKRSEALESERPSNRFLDSSSTL